MRDQENMLQEYKEKITDQKRKMDYLRRGKSDVEEYVKKMKVKYYIYFGW